jgi:polyhydroxyalkanoate synthesis regulator phasin
MNSRNVFGWDLPPGVTQRMIDESVGGDDPTEEMDAIEEEIDALEKRIAELVVKIEEFKVKLRSIIDAEK